MPTQHITVALVHGAFAESASWNPVIEQLRENSPLAVNGGQVTFEVIAVANPLRSLTGDAAYVRDVLRSIEGPVVLVAHSYGGMVITEAAAGVDAVVGLVYVAGFAPEQGESAFQLSTMFDGSTLAETLMAYPVSTGGDEVAIQHDRFHEQFASDVPAQQTALMAATQRPVTLAALSEGLPTDSPAWKQIPSWFVFGDQDLNIPVELQRFSVERAHARGSQEVAGASHAISVSQPEVVTRTILEAVAASSTLPVA